MRLAILHDPHVKRARRRDRGLTPWYARSRSGRSQCTAAHHALVQSYCSATFGCDTLQAGPVMSLRAFGYRPDAEMPSPHPRQFRDPIAI
jgi:hypothetical protein